MKKFYVYVHTCKVNGKKYVGCTTRVKPEIRWGKNGEGYKGQLFGRAIRKYGWDNFEHEAWELTCKSEMYYAEKYLIAYYHTTEREYGYNNSVGGEHGSLGCKHSEEARKKMSLSHKGKSLGEEHRKHCIEASRRKANDPEFRRKRSEAQKKMWSDSEYRERLSKAAKNRPKVKIKLPDDTIVEISKSLLTRWYINKGKKFEYIS